jgi:chaperonin cofactor prefoldin
MDFSPETLKMIESAGPWVVAFTVVGTLFIKQYFGFKLKKLDEDNEIEKLRITQGEKDYSEMQNKINDYDKLTEKLKERLDDIEERIIDILSKLT